MESKIKNWAEKLKIEPNDNAWSKIENKISSGAIKKHRANKINQILLHFNNLLIAIIIGLIVIVYFIFNSVRKNQEQKVKEKTEIEN